MTNETFTARGKYASLVQIMVSFQDGMLIATVEDEHMTESQFTKAVQRTYPEYELATQRHQYGFWYGFWQSKSDARTKERKEQ